MNPKSTPQEFFAFMAPIALEIAAQIPKDKGELFPETIMVQAADETEWNTAGCWHGIEGWEGENNFAGISPNGKLGNYATVSDYVKAYVSTISQNAFGFPAVLQATNPTLQMTRLGKSEWAGSHYDVANDGRPGKDIIAIYSQYQTDIEEAIADAKKAKTYAPATTPEVKETDPAKTETETATASITALDLPVVLKFDVTQEGGKVTKIALVGASPVQS